jgi:protein-disulfide isomerase
MLVARRRNILIGAMLMLLAACGGSGGSTAPQSDDMVYGNANAKVTVVEYYSVACPICRIFHQQVFDQIKSKYIDTGKIRFIFREVPTHDPHVAVGGFQIARCGNATPEQYLARVSVMFEQQDILDGPSRSQSDAKLFEIGRSAGLSDDQLHACVDDDSGTKRLNRNSDELTSRYGTDWGTPLVEINGERLTAGADLTPDGISRRIDAAIAAAAQQH